MSQYPNDDRKKCDKPRKKLPSYYNLCNPARRKLAREYTSWLLGMTSLFATTYTNRKGQKVLDVPGIIDPWLSRVCKQGKPMHHELERWERHLNAGHNRRDLLRQIGRAEVAEHLFVDRRRLYYVGCHYGSARFLLACLDIDDKAKQGLARKLWRQIADRLPLLARNAYVEVSPGLGGIHAYLVIDAQGVPHEQVNKLLSDLSTYLRQVAPAILTPQGKAGVDGFKGTYALVEDVETEFPSEDGPPVTTYRSLSMGVLVSLPRPKDMDALIRLKATPITTIHELAALLPDDWAGEGGQGKAAATDSVTNSTYMGRHYTLMTALGRGAKKQGNSRIVEELLSSEDGHSRKIGALFRLGHQLGRQPQFDEYEAFYCELFASNPTRDPADRRRQLRSIYKKFAPRFDPSKARQGFNPASYPFVQGSWKHKGRNVPIELVQIVVYLTESVVIDPDQQPFTVGLERILKFAGTLHKAGSISRSYAKNYGLASAARDIAARNGWIRCIDWHVPGKNCKRYVPGPNHPRKDEFMMMCGWLVQQHSRVEALTPPLQVFTVKQEPPHPWSSAGAAPAPCRQEA